MGKALDTTLLNHAATVITLASAELPADAALRQHLGGIRQRQLGPEQRRTLVQAVFAYFRWLQWLETRDSAQMRVAAALELQAKFDRNPASIKDAALAARAVPAWILDEMDTPPAYLRRLQTQPPLWIRALSGTAKELSGALGSCEPAMLPPPLDGVKHEALQYTGTQDLHHRPEFTTGRFEIQDLSSQLVGHACAPKPGEIWWDACAGEGGKTLHLADLMANKGLIWATDRSERRLEVLKRRAGRASVFNYRAAPWRGISGAPFKTKCDGVLVDAPCSGVGTWQRNPHARWTTTLDDVRELTTIQSLLLEHAAPSVKTGGRLVYSACTLTRSETDFVADAFEAAHADFEPAPLTITSGHGHRLFLRPEEVNANGMFIAAWRRR